MGDGLPAGDERPPRRPATAEHPGLQRGADLSRPPRNDGPPEGVLVFTNPYTPTPSELSTGPKPPEMLPLDQHQASIMARLQTAQMLATTMGSKSRSVIGNHLGMTASDIEREIAYFEDVKSGRLVPEIPADQIRSIVGGGA